MPRNVEIKAQLSTPDEQHARAAKLSGGDPEVIVQEDVFFPSRSGRLKLRIFSPSAGELIFYERADQSGPKTSSYSLVETTEPRQLRLLLEQALGVRNIVRKTRYLYLVGRTRIHIDQVESLGDFLELEVMLGPTEEPAAGEREAQDLMRALGIDAAQLVEGAYVDLLEEE